MHNLPEVARSRAEEASAFSLLPGGSVEISYLAKSDTRSRDVLGEAEQAVQSETGHF